MPMWRHRRSAHEPTRPQRDYYVFIGRIRVKIRVRQGCGTPVFLRDGARWRDMHVAETIENQGSQGKHRVIGSDGKLTGFGGGLPTKKALLTLEAQHNSLFQQSS
jgi:hypothetical protein